MIELTDVIFAVDSVPAVLAVSHEPFIVFASNAFAILGLRAMYFLLANAKEKFHYLSHALGAILVFVGIKMTISHWVHFNTYAVAGRDLRCCSSARWSSASSATTSCWPPASTRRPTMFTTITELSGSRPVRRRPRRLLAHDAGVSARQPALRRECA